MTLAKKLRIFVIVLICCIGGALCAYLIYAYYHYADHVPPGTYLAGEEVGGFTPDEVQAVGDRAYDSIIMDLTLKNDSGVTSVPAIAKTVTVEELGIDFDSEATVQAAMNVSASGIGDFLTRVNPFARKDIGLSVSVSDAAIDLELKDFFGDALFEDKLPKVKYNSKENEFVVTPGVVGTELDTARFIDAIKRGEFVPGKAEYEIHLNPINPKISDEAANEAAEQAKKAAKTKINFMRDDEVAYKAGGKSKASWIKFTKDEDGGKFVLSLDKKKVEKFLKTTASENLVDEPLPRLVVKEIDVEAAIEAEEKKLAEKKKKSDAADGEDSADDKKKADENSSGDESAEATSMESVVNADVAKAKNGDFSGVKPKKARMVREGVEGLAIANRAALATDIEQSMLANKNMKITPEYETTPFDTEEIDDSYGKWIETDLSKQTTYLWYGNKKLKTYRVSTGKAVTPTIPGTFNIQLKRSLHDMKGYDPVRKKKYTQPDVRWILYYDGAYAYHAAYWHNVFGTPASHGCINMRTPEAEYTYNFAPVGTLTIIHN
jgi:lipoprotein-anchoring transpeptidase ErfK/SrfK